MGTIYDACEAAFAETGDLALRVSAMKGSSYCRQFLGEFDGGPRRARLRDLARSSTEHQRVQEKRRSGIAAIAEKKLAEAHANLTQAIIGARAVHSPNVVENEVLPYDAELLDMVMLMSASPLTDYRIGSAFALARVAGAAAWTTSDAKEVLERPKVDRSFEVRYVAGRGDQP